MKCTVNFIWDKEAAVWIATSEDVEGLVLESGTLDGLIERVRVAIPELLKLNHKTPDVIDFAFRAERNDRVLVYG